MNTLTTRKTCTYDFPGYLYNVFLCGDSVDSVLMVRGISRYHIRCRFTCGIGHVGFRDESR